MNAFLSLLKPWEYTTKKIYIHRNNVFLQQPFNQLLFCKKILNCNLQVIDNLLEQNFNKNDDMDAIDSIHVIPVIKDNCTSEIYFTSNLFFNNYIHKGNFLILQDNWNNPHQASINFSNMIYDYTSIMFNNFFTVFFNNIKSNNINIYSNIADDCYKQLIDKISKLTIFYNNKLVKFNCHLYLLPNLQFQENDFLINRLQDFQNEIKDEYCSAKKINAKYLNGNNVNIVYFVIKENVSYANFDNNCIRQLIHLLEYFLDLPIYL